MRRSVLMLALVILVTGCAPAAPNPSEPPAPAPVADPQAPQPQAPPAPEPEAIAPQPIPMDPPQMTGKDADFDRPGFYVAEVATDRVWRLPYNGGFSWSASGQTVVLGNWSGPGGLDIYDLSEGAAVRLPVGPVGGAVVSPDGARIAFLPATSRSSSAQTKGLYVINLDGTGLRQLSKAENLWRYHWSPGSERIAFQELPDAAIQVADVEADTSIRISLDSPIGDFHWSPDGRSLAVAAQKGLVVYDLQTEKARTLLSEPFDASWITWSADGRRLLASAPISQSTSARELFVIDVEHPSAKVSLGQHIGSADWAPDSQHVAYINAGCNVEYDLHTVSIDGTERRRLSSSPDQIKGWPKWSPDGKAIAYSVFRRVLLADVATGQEQVVAESDEMPSLAGLMGWSADSRFLAFGLGGGKGYCH